MNSKICCLFNSRNLFNLFNNGHGEWLKMFYNELLSVLVGVLIIGVSIGVFGKILHPRLSTLIPHLEITASCSQFIMRIIRGFKLKNKQFTVLPPNKFGNDALFSVQIAQQR